jgi:hypothetical protein
MVAILEQPQTELSRYAKDRQAISFEWMKKALGHARAIELERQYQGVDELEELKKLALIQANRILVALNKPEIICWPKGWMDVPQGDCDSCGKKGYCRTISVGVTFPMDCDACHRCRDEEIDESEYRLTTPLEVALGFTTYDATDLWWVDFKSSDLALSVAQQTGLDVYDDRGIQVLTTRQAMYRLSDEKYGPFEKFGLALDEMLSEFSSHWISGLYPELIEGNTQKQFND